MQDIQGILSDTPKKLYIVFGGENYYPCGGLRDIRGVFTAEDEDAAILMAEGVTGDDHDEWRQLVEMAPVAGDAREVAAWQRRRRPGVEAPWVRDQLGP